MAVDAENAGNQLRAEPVHDSHDDDKRRHAQHDADKGKTGDDGNECFLAPRPQIAPGHHAFESGKRPGGLCPGGNSRTLVSLGLCHVVSLISNCKAGLFRKPAHISAASALRNRSGRRVKPLRLPFALRRAPCSSPPRSSRSPARRSCDPSLRLRHSRPNAGRR
ncbi:hypothetical protein D3C86_1156120 [compost metagenome]